MESALTQHREVLLDEVATALLNHQKGFIGDFDLANMLGGEIQKLNGIAALSFFFFPRAEGVDRQLFGPGYVMLTILDVEKLKETVGERALQLNLGDDQPISEVGDEPPTQLMTLYELMEHLGGSRGKELTDPPKLQARLFRPMSSLAEIVLIASIYLCLAVITRAAGAPLLAFVLLVPLALRWFYLDIRALAPSVFKGFEDQLGTTGQIMGLDVRQAYLAFAGVANAIAFLIVSLAFTRTPFGSILTSIGAGLVVTCIAYFVLLLHRADSESVEVKSSDG